LAVINDGWRIIQREHINHRQRPAVKTTFDKDPPTTNWLSTAMKCFVVDIPFMKVQLPWLRRVSVPKVRDFHHALGGIARRAPTPDRATLRRDI
jgi:hypothetical protein